jgi:hypothetical protein
VYTYNLLTIKANTLTYSKREYSVRGAGDVIWQDGRSTRRGSKIDVAFDNGEPHITLTD